MKDDKKPIWWDIEYTEEELRKLEEKWSFETPETRLRDYLTHKPIWTLFKDYNIKFTSVAGGGILDNHDLEIFSIMARNISEVVFFDVHEHFDIKSVDSLINRIKTFKAKWIEGAKIYGSIVFMKADLPATTYAEEKGLFLVHAEKDKISIINQKDFMPKDFSPTVKSKPKK